MNLFYCFILNLVRGNNFRILSAIYIADNHKNQEINLKDVTTSMYEHKLKGNLYCPSRECSARISYSGGKKAHFKTWRMDEHSEECIFSFDRIAISTGVNTLNIINVEIPYSRRQNALHEAFRIMNLTREEKTEQRNKSNTQTRNKERAVTKIKKDVSSLQMVLFEGEAYDDELNSRRSYIYKRPVDEITNSDIGKIRLVMGYVAYVKKINDVAEIIVENNNHSISVVFEEAFEAERLNSSYLKKFWSLERLMKASGNVQFTGIGDVRKNSATGRLELVIYLGSDFKVNNRDMSSLAAKYAREDFGNEYIDG